MEAANGVDGGVPSCNMSCEEVARTVSNVLGKDKFSQFIIDQGLDGEAYAELQETHLQTFKSIDGELPTLGELIKLKKAVNHIKAMQIEGASPATNPGQRNADASVNDQHQDHATTRHRCEDPKQRPRAQGAQARRGLPFQREEDEGKASATSSIFGRRRKSSPQSAETIEESEEDELTDAQIFSRPKKSRYLIDRYGAQFVLNLQQCYEILKSNVDDARKKMSNERLRNLNCGQNPKDKELLDGIEKKTRLEFDERFGGKLVTRDGREVEWPSGKFLFLTAIFNLWVEDCAMTFC